MKKIMKKIMKKKIMNTIMKNNYKNNCNLHQKINFALKKSSKSIKIS